MSFLDQDVATESQQDASTSETGYRPAKQLQARLAASGVRMTRQRKTILRLLEEADTHMDAATLLKKAREHVDIDRATVYRTLEVLKKNGLVDELDLMHLRGEMHYFEARSGREHFHLACLSCGEIREIEHPLFEALKKEIHAQESFTIETARLEVGGYCTACKNKKNQTTSVSEKSTSKYEQNPSRSLLAKRCSGSEIGSQKTGD